MISAPPEPNRPSKATIPTHVRREAPVRAPLLKITKPYTPRHHDPQVDFVGRPRDGAARC